MNETRKPLTSAELDRENLTPDELHAAGHIYDDLRDGSFYAKQLAAGAKFMPGQD